MFASSSSSGTVCGWNTSAHHDPRLVDFASTPSTSQTISPAHSPPILPSMPVGVPRTTSSGTPTSSRGSSSPRSARPSYLPYTNPTSARRAFRNRLRDPNWVARPPNAFIIFRSDYSRTHAQSGKSDDQQKANETLSKRAARAWDKMNDEQRKPFRERAEIARREHARLNPGYKYKPQRRPSENRRHPAQPSRREAVEALVKRKVASKSRYYAATSDCPTPGSTGTSSSPEPPDTPSSETTSWPADNHVHRSYSQPPLRFGTGSQVIDGPMASPPATSYYVPDRLGLSSKRSRSCVGASEVQYSPWDYVTLGDDYSDWDDAFLSADSLNSSPRSVSDELAERLSFTDVGGAAIQPSYDASQDPLQSSALLPQYSSLMQRRRGSLSESALSPLNVVTSSLANWNGEYIRQAGTAPAHSSFFPSTTPPFLISPSMGANTTHWEQSSSSMPAGSLAAPIPESDFDRTPRVAAFSQYTPSSSLSADDSPIAPDPMMSNVGPIGETDPYDVRADFESYILALQELGIPNDNATGSTFDDTFDMNFVYPMDGSR